LIDLIDFVDFVDLVDLVDLADLADLVDFVDLVDGPDSREALAFKNAVSRLVTKFPILPDSIAITGGFCVHKESLQIA
jgi:hypothetical protein